MNKEQIQKKLDETNKIFREEKIGLFAEIYSLDTMLICIDITWGDWKHEHGHADYIMRNNGFEKVGEQITEEDGSDCYSSIHYYLFIEK